jgi:purine-nucleoside phosphorylase
MVGAVADGGTEVFFADPRGRWHGVLSPRGGAVAAARAVAAAGGERSGWPGRVSLGVILGTGLGRLAERLDDAWSVSCHDTGWLASSTATGHAGRVVVGRVGGCWVAALQGRVHGYEGHVPERLCRGVELLAALGATTLLATNAAGGLRPDMQVGELVVISDHVDFVRRAWTRPVECERPDRPAEAARESVVPSRCYDLALGERAVVAAARAGVAARSGVYAHLLGPSYETRAEYRMLRRLGADVVGMSTVPEVMAAQRLGMRVAAVSVVTNVARPDAPGRTDAEDVCQAAAAAAEGVWAILEAVAAVRSDAAASAEGGGR